MPRALNARVRPHGFFLLIGLFLLVAGNLTLWRTSEPAFRFRVWLARQRGYDGCTCADCAARFGFGPPPWRSGCMPTRPSPVEVGAWQAAGGLGGVALAYAVPIIRRRWRTDPSRCPHCGYDLTGLPGPTCPECGRLAKLDNAPPSR